MEPKKNSFLEEVKLYCKIDYDFEDELLLELIESAREQICFSIDSKLQPEDLESYAKFRPLANGVLNIIHQLRTRRES